MYARIFRRADHTRRFTITSGATGPGWEVSDEQDSRVVWHATYTDWHRVERAQRHFAREAAQLAHAGWEEAGR